MKMLVAEFVADHFAVAVLSPVKAVPGHAQVTEFLDVCDVAEALTARGWEKFCMFPIPGATETIVKLAMTNILPLYSGRV